MQNKDYLIVGHFAKDLKEHGSSLGGSPFYSGAITKKLGWRVKVLTSFGPDLDIKDKKELKDFDIRCVPSSLSTTFQNVYKNGKRIQFLYQVSSLLSPKNLPKGWQKTSIVQLAPIAQEVKENMIYSFKRSLIGATLQGWLRKQNKNKEVSFSMWRNYKKFLPKINVAFLSREDIKNDMNLLKKLAKFSNILVLTEGKNGATVFHQGEIKHFAVKKVKEADPTGAGDVFAAAYLIKFYKTKNPWQAAEFANSVASSSLKDISLNKESKKRS